MFLLIYGHFEFKLGTKKLDSIQIMLSTVISLIQVEIMVGSLSKHKSTNPFNKSHKYLLHQAALVEVLKIRSKTRCWDYLNILCLPGYTQSYCSYVDQNCTESDAATKCSTKIVGRQQSSPKGNQI